MRNPLAIALLLAGAGLLAHGPAIAGPTPISQFQPAAKEHGSVISIPRFERTPDEVAASVKAGLAEADAALDAIAGQNPEQATFESTVSALEFLHARVGTLISRMYLMKETQPDAALRAACTDAVKTIEQWAVAAQYREDVYKACKAFADAHDAGRRPKLEGEHLKLLSEIMRDYRRAGLHLDKATRDRVESLQKWLSELSNNFNTNITDAKVVLHFTKDELAGVPESFLKPLATPAGRYAVNATVTPHFLMVMTNADREDTRLRMKAARFSAAQDRNGPILNELVAVRAEVARLLGYKSWADYQTEIKMARTGAEAIAFCEEMILGLAPKFEEEMAAFRAIKARKTGEGSPEIRLWDWRYYENLQKKERFNVDTEVLRNFFEFDRTLKGMFDIYQDIFGLEFTQIDDEGSKWFDDVTLWMVADAESGEPLGLFYLDNFPREGKYNHFAQFDVIMGGRLADGSYQRPVAALVCNFSPSTADRPSLLPHNEVETLFHEFGHALHTILTRAERTRFAGTNVPRDFVEAPSQMLENWVWDPTVLDTFAADYRDPSKKIDPALIERMKEARNAGTGTFYRRQLAMALGDLRVHNLPLEKVPTDAAAIINRTYAEAFLAPPEGTNFAAYWGHLTGYDAGYYGYAWADAIAADMATIFEQAPKGFLDRQVGMRLRNEVYAAGGGREIEDSIRAFLLRERSIDPFLQSIGVSK